MVKALPSSKLVCDTLRPMALLISVESYAQEATLRPVPTDPAHRAVGRFSASYSVDSVGVSLPAASVLASQVASTFPFASYSVRDRPASGSVAWVRRCSRS